MNFPGFGESAHSTDFNVDNAAGGEIQRPGRITRVADGFIQTDGGSQFVLQPGVVVDVVMPQWLLDHQ